LIDIQAAAFGFDGSAQAPPVTMEMLHLQAQHAMQHRFTDGHTYANSSEFNYVGREAHVAQIAAQTYLSMFVRDRH